MECENMLAEIIVAIVAVGISFIALIVSIISLVLQKKINSINLEAEYYKKIFDSFLLEKIPEQMFMLNFDNNTLSKNYKELNGTIMEMVRKARYFAYANPSFYKKLETKTMEIEDKLITLAARRIDRASEQKQQLIDVEELVRKLFVYINKNYNKNV